MAIPSRVVLNGREWTVEVVPGLAEREAAVGWCRRRKRKILLDASQSEDEIASTFLHELFHAAFPRRICTPEAEERIVRTLEERLHGVLAVRR